MENDLYYADNQAVAAFLLLHHPFDYEGSEVITMGGYKTFCWKFKNGAENKQFMEDILGTSIEQFKSCMRQFVKESKTTMHKSDY